jgi:hypothetical protein
MEEKKVKVNGKRLRGCLACGFWNLYRADNTRTQRCFKCRSDLLWSDRKTFDCVRKIFSFKFEEAEDD